MRFSRRWAVATAILGVVVYACAWIGWSTPWSWVVSVDDAALKATYDFGATRPGWVIGWNVLCSVFSPVAFRVVVLGVIVWAAMRRQWRLAVYLAVGVELPGLLTVVFKALSDRPRPDTALVWASSTSFPSGHAFGTTAAVLVLLALVWPRVRSRGLLLVACVAVVLLVGIGRVVLNVHHPSDVVAGWALGYAWFVATLPLLPRAREEAGTPAVRGS